MAPSSKTLELKVLLWDWGIADDTMELWLAAYAMPKSAVIWFKTNDLPQISLATFVESICMKNDIDFSNAAAADPALQAAIRRTTMGWPGQRPFDLRGDWYLFGFKSNIWSANSS
jgi:hypothetical protein